jgi:hypothetical protein
MLPQAQAILTESSQVHSHDSGAYVFYQELGRSGLHPVDIRTELQSLSGCGDFQRELSQLSEGMQGTGIACTYNGFLKRSCHKDHNGRVTLEALGHRQSLTFDARSPPIFPPSPD